MMQEEELVVDRDDDVSTRSFPGRRVHEFSIESNANANYEHTNLEVFATIIIMLSTISGGFLEGYSSPVVSSLLVSKASTSMGQHTKINNSHIPINDSFVEPVTEIALPYTLTMSNNNDTLKSTIPFMEDLNSNGTSIVFDSTTSYIGINNTDVILTNTTDQLISNTSSTLSNNTTNTVSLNTTNTPSINSTVGNSLLSNGSLPTDEPIPLDLHNISLHFTIEQASWFGSLLLLGAFMGAILSSMIIKYGRRHAILLSSIPRLVGWLFIIISPSISAINFGRFLTGISVGMVTSAGPIYISEVTHSSKRGAFSCFVQLGVNLGIFLAALLGASLAWKALAICGAVSVLLYAVPTLSIPNSPYWLVLQDRDDDAKQVLKLMRPKGYQIETEFTQIKAVAQNMKRNTSISWGELLKERRCVLPLILVLIVTSVNRFSGYNAVISYCSTFLNHAVPNISPNWTSVAVCFIQVLATLASIALVDVWGRRKLLLSSISVMGFSLILIALNDTINNSGMAWLSVVSTMMYVAAYSIGLGPLTWVILGEMLPLDARDKASAVVASVNWLAAFLVTKTFFSLEGVVGISGVCGTYSLVCAVGGVLVYLLVPETKGRTLSEIEAHFSYTQGGKLFSRQKMDRTISSIVDEEFATIDSYSTFT